MKAGDVKISAVQRVGNHLRGKILVIDEDAKDLEAYSSCLRQEGYEVRALVSYSEAIYSLESEYFDLVMVSQGSPSFEGREILERAIEMDRRMPVLVLARCLDMRCYIDAMYLGARDYFEKPLPETEILRIVRKHLGSQAGVALAA
jgi:two-component system NtrC family response regulator